MSSRVVTNRAEDSSTMATPPCLPEKQRLTGRRQDMWRKLPPKGEFLQVQIEMEHIGQALGVCSTVRQCKSNEVVGPWALITSSLYLGKACKRGTIWADNVAAPESRAELVSSPSVCAARRPPVGDRKSPAPRQHERLSTTPQASTPVTSADLPMSDSSETQGIPPQTASHSDQDTILEDAEAAQFDPRSEATYSVFRAKRRAAMKSRKYCSEETRQRMADGFRDECDGKEPYTWQLDAAEAVLLGLDCLVVAGTGAGKTYLLEQAVARGVPG
ncbi:hypothetical protein CERSUDRAFT_75551 [Gelatoporia subvermispora B]|uniref:Uncharacterized protein n=1 Tax=Ceriporiopsis subvermispora (strain B) TaxID=914234 RepID=M2R834_CERS8|nr:hypothetical protein CERSUDRAFT_75551 [Gelatoporia subvermispora B]